jgi:hypothetical protein
MDEQESPLKLNPDKTQVNWIGARQPLAGVNISQLTLSHMHDDQFFSYC